jgi:hypothetical protein
MILNTTLYSASNLVVLIVVVVLEFDMGGMWEGHRSPTVLEIIQTAEKETTQGAHVYALQIVTILSYYFSLVLFKSRQNMYQGVYGCC